MTRFCRSLEAYVEIFALRAYISRSSLDNDVAFFLPAVGSAKISTSFRPLVSRKGSIVELV
jgi:hypothetical protein